MEPTRPIDLRIPTSTFLKIAFAALVVALCVKLAPMGLLVFLSVLLAVTLAPIPKWFERRGHPGWWGVAIIVVGFAGGLTLFFGLILPSIIDQLSEVAKQWPQYRERLLTTVPASSFLHNPLEKYLHGGAGALTTNQWVEKFLTAGTFVGGALVEFLLLLVTSVYLVVDGPRVFKFLEAFFSEPNQLKLRKTGSEISDVIFAYVAGQAITSLLVFFCTLIVLESLHVPAALTLAVLAGIFDILPVLGFFMSAVPAVLLASTVSPGTAALVATYCVTYHAIENYLIVPKVYGSRLRLSTLTVLLSLIAADLVAGIPGAIAVLPLVASYPIIEAHWLKPWLGRSTVEEHQAQDEEEEGPRKQKKAG